MKTASATHKIALNAAGDRPAIGASLALNAVAEGVAPEWVKLMPRGPRIAGVDGRGWTLADPGVLVTAFNAAGRKLPIDINHSQFLRAPKGEDSPAVAWIEALEVRDGETFGRVSWTPRGRRALNMREYSYLSPVFRFDPKGNVVALRGAALTNDPNLDMPALNAANHEDAMDKDLLKKLGLAETATALDAIAAIDALQTAANASRPSLADYVPRADFDLALGRASAAEALNAAQAKKVHDDKVATAIAGAIAAGKITPASKDFYIATCASEAGLAEFEKFVAAQPSVFTDSGLDTKDAGKTGVALNAAQSDTARAMGIDPKAFAAFVAPAADA